MAKIYLSSTYTDLKACREAVYHTLRQMRQDVIAMEDYVATDQRPIEKCLADVVASDLYIGIFAWRYGYIPHEMNPEHKSITELEYRRAQQIGKACLLFLLDEEATWSRRMMDEVTGQGNRGECIQALRDELVREKTVKFFKTPEELASLVSTSVSNWEKSRTPAALSNVPPSSSKDHLERIQREERLKALIIDHSGFIQSRLESFVGRGQELADIRRNISMLLTTGGYLTITGQAGQGKSSIIARLVQDSHPGEVAHHFIPFNPGSDYQVGLLRDLMAQLILKHDLSDYYVASESRPALRDFFPKVLDAIAAKGSQEVIFIDGLDQLKEDADGERDLSFLPNNPPQGIVFVLGTRPNETLQPLELFKPHHSYRLPGLTRHDFDLILKHRYVWLEPSLADRFYKTMGENALYLDLVAKELALSGAKYPEELIERVADDPENIFTLSMTRLKRNAVEWREVLKPLLGVLLVVREPLTGRQLRAILHLDDERLRAGIERLGGLVADDGKQRYSLFHLKLYDYLRQDEKRPHKAYIFAKDEEESWHDSFSHWCEQGDISFIWNDDMHNAVEQGRREYARKFYITHMFLSHEWQQPQQQRLFAVLDTLEYGRAKIRDDPSTRSYTLDLDMGRQASAWEGWTLSEGIAYLPRLWQYTFLRCSLTSRADRYPKEAFQLLVLLEKKQQALGLAELMSDHAKKAGVLLLIARQLREQANDGSEWFELLMRAGDVAQTIQESSQKAETLRDLGTILTEAQQREQAARVWEVAERAIHVIRDSSQQAEALCKLGIVLTQAQQWEQAARVWEVAERAIVTTENTSQQAKALRDLSTTLAKAQQWEQAERVIDTIQDGSQQAEALRELGTALAKAQQWEQAEHVIRTIQNSSQQAEGLRDLGIDLAKAQRWEQAERVILTIRNKWEQAEALRALAQALSLHQQWIPVRWVISTIPHGWQRVEALISLRQALIQANQQRLAQRIWTETKWTIGVITIKEERMAILVNLAQALAQHQHWFEAERVIVTIEDIWLRDKALVNLAQALAQHQHWFEAERVISNIEGERDHDKALRNLAKYLAQHHHWTEAKWTMIKIMDRGERVMALRKLEMALSQAGKWQEAERVIRTIQDSSQQAEALRELGIALANMQRWDHASRVWEQAEHVISTIRDNTQKTKALQELAVAMVNASAFEQLLHVIQRAWSRVEGREEALALFSLASTFISLKPEVGITFFEAFSWVDTFSGG